LLESSIAQCKLVENTIKTKLPHFEHQQIPPKIRFAGVELLQPLNIATPITRIVAFRGPKTMFFTPVRQQMAG